MSALLEIDTTDFVADGRSPQRVRHQLRDHALLSVEAVAQLAGRLPEAQVEHNVATGIGSVVPGGAPALDLPRDEIARGIETNDCWMVLKNIEADPPYAALLNEALDAVAPLLPGGPHAMLQREGFLFLSAPGSVTPAHVDPEHNFLLQVRGDKTMHVGAFPDRETQDRELERSFAGGHRNMSFLPDEMQPYLLRPGDGLYVPVGAPHWVQNGPSVSVSLSITWRTRETLHAYRVHAFNDRLRRRGLAPAPLGRRPRVDDAKALATRVLGKADSVLRRSGR